MNSRSKDEIRDIIHKDLLFIHNHGVELSNRLAEALTNSMSHLHELLVHLSQPSTGPLMAKTPKMLRKKVVQHIETILEDEVLQNISPTSSLYSINEEKQKENEVMGGRIKRGASKKAEDNIRKQSSILNNSKKKVKRESHIKRKKYNISSSDEDENVSKYSKVEESITDIKGTTKRVTRKNSKQIVQPTTSIEKSKITEKAKVNENNFELPVLRRSSRRSSKSSQNREVNTVNDAIMPNIDDIEEPSMYEDAVGRPVPIMNSTLKYSPFMSKKELNATVVLDRLPNQPPKLNETVVIQKAINIKNSSSLKETENTKNTLPNNTQAYKTPAQYDDYNELITDDESSPEVIRPKKQLNRKQPNKKETEDMLAISSEETSNIPVKTLKNANVSTVTQESKTYKSNALFSPYAKESVKKRVEAFEQAVMHSPKSVDIDAPTRITRTKTRAMATAEMQAGAKTTEKNVAQILARKSLAKAKKISLAKQKNNNEFKENKEQLPERINKLLTQTDKSNVKMQQLKTTPLSKTKLMQPYPKILTASRNNIVIGVESFIQPITKLPKTITTSNSVEKLEEKKRHEEDARKKKDEALRLQTEEKKRKRQEKELKNKLAREAKEKQELEKRQKTEKEREEKAKLALLTQERHREEAEKKRLAQLQRIQEKEERRKLEEQQRLQRLQEQEETERLLAEQRRREQEAERRREAEARAQQAAAEALKQKNQLLAAQAKHKQQTNNKYQGTVNYVLDSEPDDDEESDDESKPKHEIPYWAQAHIRKAQLAMQQYIPEGIVSKFFNTRKCTPDLTELFHGIDRNRLKRTSSAIWKTPPRISMMEPEFVEQKLPLKN
ncbi:PREDICTED: inner centromere protein A isoform X2 [Trachymyrmex cornetzi]|uniref:inner centromere protein A isoform X2 n=1 Tax=Trachymyrmex cornetzi TaxID=471704 RepID=UPI00084ED550|nr:PREDICTED: inner centromere protein A isoform X2 [Trachymyrmex cornetzi]